MAFNFGFLNKIKRINPTIRIVNFSKPGSSKEEPNTHLEKMRKKELYTFLGSNLTMVFHKKDCPLLDKTTKSTLIGLSSHPKTHWKPCSHCNPQIVNPKKKKAKKRKIRRLSLIDEQWAIIEKSITKNDLLGAQLKKLCMERGIFAEISDKSIDMTTISGEWHFNFIERPIVVYHRNYHCVDGYHIQERAFPTPIHVIAYVQKHDIRDMKRIHLGSMEHRLAKELAKVPLPLHTDQYLM